VATTATVAYPIVKPPGRVDRVTDARQQRVELGLRQAAVAAEGRHLVEPLHLRVAPRPVELPSLGLAERPGPPDPVDDRAEDPVVGAQRVAWTGGERGAGQHPTVDLRERLRQSRRGLLHVPEEPEQTTGPQCARGLGRTDGRIDPVPGLSGDDRVELPSGRVPFLERSDLHLEAPLRRERGHARVDLHAEHLPGVDVPERPQQPS
jgi:hypothetical protein